MSTVTILVDHIPSRPEALLKSWAGFFLSSQGARPLVQRSPHNRKYVLDGVAEIERLDALTWNVALRDEESPEVLLQSWRRVRDLVGVHPFRFARRARACGGSVVEITTRRPIGDLKPYLDSPYLRIGVAALADSRSLLPDTPGSVRWAIGEDTFEAVLVGDGKQAEACRPGAGVVTAGTPGGRLGEPDIHPIDVFFTTVPNRNLEANGRGAVGSALPSAAAAAVSSRLVGPLEGRISATPEAPNASRMSHRTPLGNVSYTRFFPNRAVARIIATSIARNSGRRSMATPRSYTDDFCGSDWPTAIDLTPIMLWNSHPTTFLRLALHETRHFLGESRHGFYQTVVESLEADSDLDSISTSVFDLEAEIARVTGFGRIGRYLGRFSGFSSPSIPPDGFAPALERNDHEHRPPEYT